MGDIVNDLLDNLTDAMLAREDSCYGLSRPHERDRAITQWHNAVDAIRAALTREPLPTGTAGVIEASANLNVLTQKIALEAYEHWGADRDSKVGKLLRALGGETRIRPDLDNARAALAASTRTGEDDHPTTPTRGSDECEIMEAVRQRAERMERLIKQAYEEGWNTGTWEAAREANGSNANARESDWHNSRVREALRHRALDAAEAP